MDAGRSTATAGTCAVQVHAKHLAQLLIQFLIQVLMQLQVHHAKVQVQQVQQVREVYGDVLATACMINKAL